VTLCFQPCPPTLFVFMWPMHPCRLPSLIPQGVIIMYSRRTVYRSRSTRVLTKALLCTVQPAAISSLITSPSSALQRAVRSVGVTVIVTTVAKTVALPGYEAHPRDSGVKQSRSKLQEAANRPTVRGRQHVMVALQIGGGNLRVQVYLLLPT
jgi:hypothetical protein